MAYDATAKSGWARLVHCEERATVFGESSADACSPVIQRATGQQHAGSMYSFSFQANTGNASLKMLGTTYRCTAATDVRWH